MRTTGSPLLLVMLSAVFPLTTGASAPTHPELYGFSLNDQATALIERYQPILPINGMAVIVARKLQAPLDHVQFKYNGNTITSLELSVSKLGTCSEELDDLTRRFGKPEKLYKQDMFWAHWVTETAEITATGNCIGAPLEYKISFVHRSVASP